MESVLSGLTALVVAMTFLPLSRSSAWWIRVLDFPRFQLLLAAAFLLVLEITTLNLFSVIGGMTTLLTLACVLYQFHWVKPYTRLNKKEVAVAEIAANTEKIKLVCANVLTPNKDAPTLLKLIKLCDPDIVLTLESDEWWQQQLSVLESEYVHSIKCPLSNLYGMHLYSKLPLVDCEVKYLLSEEIPSIHCKIQLPSGTLVRCHFLHPAPPVPEFSNSSEQRDAELIAVAKSVGNEGGPVIVAGDLNDVAWSETTRLFRKISGLLDPRVGRGLINTFHADYWFLRWPLDHLFHSKHFTVSELYRLPKFGSDHFALVTELVLEEKTHTENAAGLTPSSADKAQAKEILSDQEIAEKDIPQ